MLESVKVDKLCFGFDKSSPALEKKIDAVILKYYSSIIASSEPKKYKKYYRCVTPTKQLRYDYEGFNHNLQMIPLEQFKEFLVEVSNVARQDVCIYEMHLAKDILTKNNTDEYLETVKSHEYLNGYVSSTFEADSTNTVYVSKKKALHSDRKQKLLIKLYNKTSELIAQNEANRVLQLKEPIESKDIPMGFAKGTNKYGMLLYQMNLMRCEIELRESNLPYLTFREIIDAIDSNTFKDAITRAYEEKLKQTMFLEPAKKMNRNSIKSLAIELMRNSDRCYKLLFANAGMGREYNYFKRAKEVVTRENDLNFEELRMKLLSENGYYVEN